MKKISGLFIVLIFMLTLCACEITGVTYRYDQSFNYTELTNQEVTLTEAVTKLNVNWLNGDIKIVEGSELSIKEVSKDGDYSPLYYKVSNGLLDIRYIKSGTKSSVYQSMTKDLEITVPSALLEVELNIISSNYIVDCVYLDKLDVDVVSGNGQLRFQNIKDVDIDVVSGYVTMIIGEVDVNNNIKIDSVSGEIQLYLDVERGNNIDFDSVSGYLAQSFEEGTNKDLEKRNIKINTVSSKVSIYGYNLVG